MKCPDAVLKLRAGFLSSDGDGFVIEVTEVYPARVRLLDRGHTVIHISHDQDGDALFRPEGMAALEGVLTDMHGKRESLGAASTRQTRRGRALAKRSAESMTWARREPETLCAESLAMPTEGRRSPVCGLLSEMGDSGPSPRGLAGVPAAVRLA